MSLINEALKKAQKQRGGEVPPPSAMPAVSGQPAAQPARPSRPVRSGAPVLAIGISAAVVVAVVAGGAFIFLRPKSAEPIPQNPPIVAQSPRPQPPVAASTPPPAPVETPAVEPAPVKTEPAPSTFVVSAPVTPAPVPVEPVKPKREPGRPPIIIKSATAAAATTAPVAVATSPATEPVPASGTGKMDSRAIDLIENLRVAGIRASANDSKVLMNDRVYRAGNIVDRQLGIRLTGITTNSLSFTDEHGATYTREF